MAVLGRDSCCGRVRHRWRYLVLLLHFFLLWFNVGTDTSELTADGGCRDEYLNCAERLALLQQDSCSGHPDLLASCKRSCNACPPLVETNNANEDLPVCQDDNELCDEWATNGECVDIGDQCKKACGFCDGEDEVASKRKSKDKKGKKPGSERHDLVPDSECRDHHASCEAWAAIRWCSKDPVLMQSLCPESCYMCTAARKAVLQRVETLQNIFSGEAIYSLQGTDRDRFIPGVDPVFKLSRADNADLLIEPAEVLGVGYGRHGGSSQNKLRRYSVDAVQEDVDELMRVPGLGGLCIDWHPSCPIWLANGDCLENPFNMDIMCRASCGMCKGEWEDWETISLEPEVQHWFSGAWEGGAPVSASLTDNKQKARFDWGADREVSIAAEQMPAAHSHSHGSHAKKTSRKVPSLPPRDTVAVDEVPLLAHQEKLDFCQDSKPEQCKGVGHTHCSQHASDMATNCRETCGLCPRTRDYHPVLEKDLADGGREYPTIGLSINGMGNDTKRFVEAAIAAGVSRLEAEIGAGSAARLDLLGSAIQASGVARHSLYISLIVAPEGYAAVIHAVVEALRTIRTGYVDMALLKQDNKTFPELLLNWQALEKLHAIEAVRALGAADGEMSYTGFIRRRTSVPFALMQRSMDPFLPDQRAVDIAYLRGLTYVALNLLGSRWLKGGTVRSLPTVNNTALQALSKRRQHSIVLLCVRWALQRGVALTLSMSEIVATDIPSLMQAFSFHLKDSDMNVIDSLERVNPTKPPAAKHQQQRSAQQPPAPQQVAKKFPSSLQSQQSTIKRVPSAQQAQLPAIKRVPSGQQALRPGSGSSKNDWGSSIKQAQKLGPAVRGRPGGKTVHNGHSR